MGRIAAPLPGLRADQSYAEAGRLVIGVRSHELFKHVDGLLDLDEPERVHKMRVATRRLRAGLEVFSAAFPAAEKRAALGEVKTLAAALGERRDCDVQIEFLDALRETVGRSERVAVDELREQLRGSQRKANRRLAAALAHAEREALAERLQQLVK
jgi:CHAD domain-containing protein